MYKLIEWSSNLDLSEFYKKAEQRGFDNNASQSAMVNCFDNERLAKIWILYQNDHAVGSVAAHSLDILGSTSYRICARTCSFAEARPSRALITINRLILEHQNLTAQFFIPAAIDWCGKTSNMYISSHPSNVGTQRLVHNIYCPTLEKHGILTKSIDLEYRGHLQTFWKLNVSNFLTDLAKYPRW